MNDKHNLNPPAIVQAIQQDTTAHGFPMASEPQTGSLLRTLATTKPGGAFLELGTGAGLSTAWILAGMDPHAHLLSVDSDDAVQAIAKRHLGHDPRLTLQMADGAAFLETLGARQFDFIFADTWPGKYDHLAEALAAVKPGGFYIIDDMLPQPNWPSGHAEKVPVLIAALEQRPDFQVTKLSWASGLIIATKSAY
jgi:predicted O-methyltransferase YrrM